jgi:hypothetical protein
MNYSPPAKNIPSRKKTNLGAEGLRQWQDFHLSGEVKIILSNKKTRSTVGAGEKAVPLVTFPAVKSSGNCK